MDRIPHNMNPGGTGGRRPPPPNPRPGAQDGNLDWRVFVAAALVGLLFFAGRLLNLWVDSRWFTEVGYSGVFWTIFRTRWTLGFIFALLFLLISLPNIWLALKMAPPPAIPVDLRGQVEMVARRSLGPLLYSAAALVAFFTGVAAASRWNEYLLFRNAVPFGVADPLFQHDVAFYVFRLPFLAFLVGFAFISLFLTLVGVAFVYGVTLTQYYDPVQGWLVAGRRVPARVARHISVLAALLLLVKAMSFWIQRYDLLYGYSSVIPGGAGYADLHARLPVLNFLVGLTVVAAGLWLVQLAFKRVTWGLAAVAVLVAVTVLGGGVYPGLLEQIRVKPNQFVAEEPYIRRHIEFTRRAYGLHNVRQTEFAIRNNLTPALLRQNAPTINNARLWDYGIAEQAFRQLQEFKPYYRFLSVDVDRYTVDNVYRQLLISVREMDQDALPEQAKTFQNRHLVYTHGFGLVVSPVNEVTPDNQPAFLVRNIPPATSTNLKITQPRIYFGESDQDWAVVGTNTTEFDYPGSEDVYRNYTGKAGLSVGSGLSRLLLAFYLGDQNFLLSKEITPASRLLIRRKVDERVRSVAPFLRLDRDMYPVVADGRVMWLQDAYTTTSRYPYSAFTEAVGGDINYMRNSVKVAVDAYDGTVTFYAADAQDPVLAAYSRAFPNMFQPMSAMPAALRAHVRYPEDLFNVQSEKYLTYHMTDTRTFFTKEDAWDLPKNARQTLGSISDNAMEAYYVIMRLPGEANQEMVLIRPFTPRSRNNMVAWMAARCDPRAYGEVVVYHFPIGDLPLGPAQIEASILQKPEISKDITLLNQEGSRVVMGNMITLPIERSLLYIQPLYVQSANQGNRRAELVRVIVGYGNRVEMGETLAGALNSLFGSGSAEEAEETPTGQSAATAPARRGGATVQDAVQAFDRAQAAQRRGDWAGYGTALRDLERTLRALENARP